MAFTDTGRTIISTRNTPFTDYWRLAIWRWEPDAWTRHSHPFSPGAFGRIVCTRMTPHIILYDDECPMCTFQMRLLSWLDWGNRLALMPLSSAQARQVAPSLQRDDLLAAIHCVTATGRIYRGARCIRFAGMRLPLLLPLSLLLWVPGVIQVAEAVYQTVSQNRHLLSRVFGCKEACAMMPKRARQQDKVA